MKLPPLKMPCHVPQPPVTHATDLGYPIRVIEGSVWRWDHEQCRVCFGDEAVTWIQQHVTDDYWRYQLAVQVSGGKAQAQYDNHEAANRKRYQRIRRKAK